jgi:hypothetical protein
LKVELVPALVAEITKEPVAVPLGRVGKTDAEDELVEESTPLPLTDHDEIATGIVLLLSYA